MDHFGIGTALESTARIYFQTARRTGRTLSLVESLRTGDRVVFHDQREADRVKRMCLEREQEVECIVVAPDEAYKLRERGTPTGRLLFDHSWVERYYLLSLERSRQEIDHMQRELGGFGEAHLETRRQAEELQRWRF